MAPSLDDGANSTTMLDWGSSADEHGRLLQLRESGVTNRHSRTAGSAQNFHLGVKLLCKRVHK
jgi:hypothetical protein